MAARLDIRDTTAISFIYERKREKSLFTYNVIQVMAKKEEGCNESSFKYYLLVFSLIKMERKIGIRRGYFFPGWTLIELSKIIPCIVIKQ